jgi:shikimate kinase
MADQRIWLTGLMGSGKSSVGHSLARWLGCRYIDNDEEIRLLAGRSTVALASAGDGELHQWESRYALHAAARPAPLVAGIPASVADRPPDLRTLRRTGYLVYLSCDLSTLVTRVRADPPRPWLDGDPEDLMAQLLATRHPVLTKAAHLVVDGGETVDEIVTRIVAALPD